MERFDNNIESISENNSVTGGDATIDTQMEIELISGGVGFDDDISENLKNGRKEK